MKIQFKKSVLSFLILAQLTSCATSPESAGISEEEINIEANKAYQEVKAKAKISNNKRNLK